MIKKFGLFLGPREIVLTSFGAQKAQSLQKNTPQSGRTIEGVRVPKNPRSINRQPFFRFRKLRQRFRRQRKQLLLLFAAICVGALRPLYAGIFLPNSLQPALRRRLAVFTQELLKKQISLLLGHKAHLRPRKKFFAGICLQNRYQVGFCKASILQR